VPAQPNILDHLLGHHQQITLLFGQIEQSPPEHQGPLFSELVALLAVHESVEQALLHPLAAGELAGGGEMVEQRLAEEDEAKQALTRLYDMGTADPDFIAELVVLRDAVAAHAQAEERTEFAALREVADPAVLLRMDAALHALAQLPEALDGPPEKVFAQAQESVRAAVAKHAKQAKDSKVKARS
jgi:hypothetical protein